jgi:hypothetical protein
MPSAVRSVLPVVLIVVLAGCAAPAPRAPARPPEITHPLPADPASVVSHAGPVLESRGIEIVEADPTTGIVRGHADGLGDTPWAQCPVARIQDTDGQRIRIAEPEDTDLDLELALTPAGDGSSLVIRPTFERTYLDSFRFRKFQRRCPSTGVLERDLTTALGAA